MKASTLFEKEHCDSLKQASISDFFKKFLLNFVLLYSFPSFIPYPSNNAKQYYSTISKMHKTYVIISLSRTFLATPTYRELRLTRTPANSDHFFIPLEGPT